MLLNMYLKQRGKFFDADGGAGGGASGTDGGSTVETATFEPPKSADELNNLIKAATDKALETAQASWKTSQTDEISRAVAEANRIAKLSADEREKELEKKRVSDLDQRESTIKLQEVTLKATDMLTAKGLPLSIRDLVIGKDEAETKAKIDAFESVFQKEIEKTVNQKLALSAKPNGGTTSNKSYDEMSMEELSAALYPSK